tara:strand:+ start:234 stop:686 length:453 start_codon:yes stop_codon:yes gene_type:complete
MAIDFNSIIGISWKDWVRSPNNKRLFESNPAKARARYMEEEAEFIENIILQERIKDEQEVLLHQRANEAKLRQQSLSQQLREIVNADSDTNVVSVSGFGGAAAGGGSGEGDSRTAGVGYMVVGAWMNNSKVVVNSEPDVGYERWIVGPPQ